MTDVLLAFHSVRPGAAQALLLSDAVKHINILRYALMSESAQNTYVVFFFLRVAVVQQER